MKQIKNEITTTEERDIYQATLSFAKPHCIPENSTNCFGDKCERSLTNKGALHMPEAFQIKLKYLSNTMRKDLGEFSLHHIHDETLLREELKSIFKENGYKFLDAISQFYIVQNSEIIPLSIENLTTAEEIRLYSVSAQQNAAEIARFNGVVIQMHYKDREHWLPHFHVYKNREKLASIQINPVLIIKGSLESSIKDKVLDWANLHQSELSQMWDEQKIRKL